MPSKTKMESAELPRIKSLQQKQMKFRIIGTSPLVFNSMSRKAREALFIGAKRKTAKEKQDIKHNPELEFQDSLYTQGQGTAYLSFPSTGIKRGMATAALETEGVTKASINRGIYLPEEHVNIWGKPYMFMSVVRSSDMNRTPDIRTRGKLPRWCTEFTVRYIVPTFNQTEIASLVMNAGFLCGLGDWRIEKGGPMGGYKLVTTDEDVKIFNDIVKNEGKSVQEISFKDPQMESHDNASHELYEDLTKERQKREAILAVAS